MFTSEKNPIWVRSPEAEGTSTKGVWLYPGEVIEWHYVCTPLGMLVTGYTVKPSRIDGKSLREVQ
jgi:hypothetical protein